MQFVIGITLIEYKKYFRVQTNFVNLSQTKSIATDIIASSMSMNDIFVSSGVDEVGISNTNG